MGLLGYMLQKITICSKNISETLSFTSYATILLLQTDYPREPGAQGKVDILISCHVSELNVINAVL